MRDVSSLLTGNLETIPDGSSRLARTGAQSLYTIQDVAGNPYNPLSAISAETVAKIDIQPFYLLVNGVLIPVLSAPAQISGLTPGVVYYVYYDDPTFLGGSVTLLATTNYSLTQDSAGRFLVGSIYTPVFTDPGNVTYRPTTYSDTGTASSANETHAYDGDSNTYSISTAGRDANGSYTTNVRWYGITDPPGVKSAINLKIDSELGAFNSVGGALAYSLDGGGTWTNIYSQNTTRARTVDSVALAVGQNWSLVWVRVISLPPAAPGIGGYIGVFDIRIEGTLS
jgi:hypothetical protein